MGASNADRERETERDTERDSAGVRLWGMGGGSAGARMRGMGRGNDAKTALRVIKESKNDRKSLAGAV